MPGVVAVLLAAVEGAADEPGAALGPGDALEDADGLTGGSEDGRPPPPLPQAATLSRSRVASARFTPGLYELRCSCGGACGQPRCDC